MIRLENISWATPDGRSILNDVSLTIPDGKLFAITGPNGGGKTTLAKLIAGIITPSCGRIYFNDIDITEKSVTERARLGIAYAFQQPVRFKGITVRNLIEIAAGGSVKEPELCNILASVGLCARDYLSREINSTLSGGEIKRIEIATVLARKAPVSVFDEPEAGIDLWSFAGLIKTFEAMRKELKGSLIIVSHQERLLRIADEIVLLADGKLSAQGSGQQLLNELISSGNAGTSCEKREAIING